VAAAVARALADADAGHRADADADQRDEVETGDGACCGSVIAMKGDDGSRVRARSVRTWR
jgi:hypothetical protein